MGNPIYSDNFKHFYEEIDGYIPLPPSPAQGDILYFDGTNWVTLAVGSPGDVLATQGASANPHWIPQSGGSGVTEICEVADITTGISIPSSSIPTILTFTEVSSIGGFHLLNTDTEFSCLVAGDYHIDCFCIINQSTTSEYTAMELIMNGGAQPKSADIRAPILLGTMPATLHITLDWTFGIGDYFTIGVAQTDSAIASENVTYAYLTITRIK